jgi:hypothetical protein
MRWLRISLRRYNMRHGYAYKVAADGGTFDRCTSSYVWSCAFRPLHLLVRPRPDGRDAVQAAPASHRVVFENAFVRVVYVTLPQAGSSEPMHTHRWPSVFLGYDTGGKTAHIRYHTPDGRVRDIPSQTEPVHPGRWSSGRWMAPEPMHSIEVVENPAPGPGGFPGWLRVEVKCTPK